MKDQVQKWIQCRDASTTWELSLKSLPKDVVAYCICPFLDLRIEISFERSLSKKNKVITTNENVVKALYGRTNYRSDKLSEFEYHVYFRRVYFSCDYIHSLNFEKLLRSLPNAELTSLSLHVGSFTGEGPRAVVGWHRLIDQFTHSLPNLRELQLPSSGYRSGRINLYFPLFRNTSILPKLRVVDLGRWNPFKNGEIRYIPDDPLLGKSQALITSLIKARITTLSEISFSISGPTDVECRSGHVSRTAVDFRLKFVRGNFVEFRRRHPLSVIYKYSQNRRMEMVNWMRTFDYRRLFVEIGFPETMYFENWHPLTHEFMYCDAKEITIEWDITKCTRS